MPRIVTLAVLALFATPGAAFAADPAPGDYQLTVGRSAPCVLSFAADGGAHLAPDCKDIKPAAHWRVTGPLLKLLGPDDNTVALLKASRDGYVGRTLPDGLELTATH